MGKIVIRQTGTGFKFDLKASNGETIATSEVYATKAACIKGAQSVAKCAADAGYADLTAGPAQGSHPRFELYEDKAGHFRFRLKARNGAVIAVSEGYRAKTSCENGIDSVRKNAPDASVVEEL